MVEIVATIIVRVPSNFLGHFQGFFKVFKAIFGHFQGPKVTKMSFFKAIFKVFEQIQGFFKAPKFSSDENCNEIQPTNLLN